jgi:hypothetical protein
MIVEEVKKRIELIKAKGEFEHDDEVAHSMEDQLWQDVLTAIAEGYCEDPKALAGEALRTVGLDFSRWCA